MRAEADRDHGSFAIKLQSVYSGAQLSDGNIVRACHMAIPPFTVRAYIELGLLQPLDERSGRDFRNTTNRQPPEPSLGK